MAITRQQIEEIITKLNDWKTVCLRMKKEEKADAYSMAIGLLRALIKD